jgi:hypothetical protein
MNRTDDLSRNGDPMHHHETVTDSLLNGGEPGTIQDAVTACQPDGQVPCEELAWWVALQERLETRAELAAAVRCSGERDSERPSEGGGARRALELTARHRAKTIARRTR